ncbi:M15 family metallopeptidase [Marinicella sediminis]|uniref:M15 family metallopeptidase n=1 Tax=Marinicella sediminis TaxID=1792834 RepID=A0ABV7JEL0_9GAMM|nr:M15 family metallopeptidase [Marinicella sediminis]
MISINTDRLSILPTHKNCWSIHDRSDEQLIGKLFFRDQWFNILLKPQSLRLGVATEASYGLMKAINSEHYKARTAVPHAQQFLTSMGFSPTGDHYEVTIEHLKQPDPYHTLNHQLDIDITKLKTPVQWTAAQLIDTDNDCFGRPAKLHPRCAAAWQAMKSAAAENGIELQLASAYRSMKYQAHLIAQKQRNKQAIEDILITNAAPGHSEHHTGCAIDITTPGFTPLEEAFENSAAFQWLNAHGADHGFSMSYPRENPHGIIYEPWHWRHQS